MATSRSAGKGLASRSIFGVYISNWECSVGQQEMRPRRPLKSLNNIPKPRREYSGQSHPQWLISALSFPLFIQPARNCCSFVKIMMTLIKQEGRLKWRKNMNGIGRFIPENLEINRHNLSHYIKEKDKAQRWGVFLKTL